MAVTELPRRHGQRGPDKFPRVPLRAPGGRVPPDIRELARVYSRAAIKALAKISQDENQPTSARVAAISVLRECGNAASRESKPPTYNLHLLQEAVEIASRCRLLKPKTAPACFPTTVAGLVGGAWIKSLA